MDEIKIIQIPGTLTFNVIQGDRYSEELSWDEMLGVVIELTYPPRTPFRSWMKTEEEHKAMREFLKRYRKYDLHTNDEAVVYTPDNWDPEENDGKEGYTFMDFINLAGGSYPIAKLIHSMCEWQHPSTVLEDLLREGEIKTENGNYILKKDAL